MDKEELEKQMNETAEEFAKILRGLEEEKEYSRQGSTECFGRQ